MTGFAYHDGRLCCEEVPLDQLAASLGTPLYVYSERAILERLQSLQRAFADLTPGVRYAVKANGNGALLRLLQAHGSGFDIVSGGELLQALRAGADPADCVFAGVGKQDWEIRLGLRHDIGLFNVESEAELDRIEALATEEDRAARLALRLNPDVAVGTHDYIATGRKQDKFGVDFATAARLIPRIQRSARLRLRAYHVHLGSLLLEPGPYLEAAERVLAFLDEEPERVRGIEAYDMGGGFGIRDLFSDPLPLAALAVGMGRLLKPRGWRLLLEPGRFLVGNAGLLLLRVLHRKPGAGKDFLIVDGAMNDLIRPALYQARHPILTMVEGQGPGERPVDVVGPVCESADFLAKDRPLPPLERGDLIAIGDAGAYGFSMASRYNSRPMPAEVLCRGAEAVLIRAREAPAQLWAQERDEPVDLDSRATDPPFALPPDIGAGA